MGLDPAQASLDIARKKPEADRVRWIHGDVGALPPLQVDLITMTGNVAQVFLTDAEEAEPFQSFRGYYRFSSDGAVLVSDSTLRFRGREEVERSLDAAQFAVDDVRDAPDRPGREMVFIARPAASRRSGRGGTTLRFD